MNLRLTKPEDAAGRALRNTPSRNRRRRRGPGSKKPQPQPETSDEEARTDNEDEEDYTGPTKLDETAPSVHLSVVEREIQELEDEQVRSTNAYPGAKNTIGSVYQRRWYLSLDRRACAFTKKRIEGRPVWEYDRKQGGSSDDAAGRNDGDASRRLAFPFYVRGANHERSVVTGRQGVEILLDEGVEDFVPRKGWTPVLN